MNLHADKCLWEKLKTTNNKNILKCYWKVNNTWRRFNNVLLQEYMKMADDRTTRRRLDAKSQWFRMSVKQLH